MASPSMRASGRPSPTPDAVAAASASGRMTYKCGPATLDTPSSTSRTHGLDVEERLSRIMCGQLSRKKMGGNSSKHTTMSSGIPGRAPFQEITNVADSHSLSKMKQGKNILGSVDHQVTGKKRSINTSSVSKQSSASEHKRYHDRERYLRMTPEQRGAYLQRNREYKRRKKNLGAVGDSTQSAMSQTCTSTVGNVHTTTLPSTSTEVATVESSSFSPSYNILQDDIISPITENHTMTSPSDISTSCNECVITAQNKRIAKFLDNGGENKRRRISHGASCDYTVKETHEHVVAKEQKDHDSTVYVPNGYFPAIEDESGQAEDITEDDDGDDEGYIFSGQGTDYVVSYQDPNYANCKVQVDPFDHIYQNIPSGHHVLEPVPKCKHCNAKRFQYENPTFCCMGGKVKIVTPRVPDEMRRLYTSQDPDAKYFQDNIRICRR